jgi:hypothetical protein
MSIKVDPCSPSYLYAHLPSVNITDIPRKNRELVDKMKAAIPVVIGGCKKVHK